MRWSPYLLLYLGKSSENTEAGCAIWIVNIIRCCVLKSIEVYLCSIMDGDCDCISYFQELVLSLT